ncbi:MAG: MarR family winged helix-turn-helix transcriptional regulator, partial [Stackebrandtia sp.]
QSDLGTSDLARRIGLSQPAAVRMVDQLTARGLVRRRRHSARSVEVSLTATGRSVADQALAARREALSGQLAGISASQRPVLTEALEELLRRLYDEVGSENVLCKRCDRGACVAAGQVCPVGQAARAGGERP